MKTNLRLLTALLFLFCVKIQSQDLHFSQFQEHHALINPALTGATSSYRAVMGYKNQWRTAAGAPYKTFGTSFEKKVLHGNWKKSNEKVTKTERRQDVGRVGAGLSVYRDRAGEGDMGTTQINLSIASFVPTGNWSFLSAGIQSSLAFRRVDQEALIFPNQYSPLEGGYSSRVSSGENIPSDRYRYFDFAAGMMWSYGFAQDEFVRTKQTRAKFGLAAYHLTQPDLRFIGTASESLKMRYVAHGDMVFSIKKSDLAIAPAFFLQIQGTAMEIIGGTTFKYYLNPNSKYTGNVKSTCLNFGAFYRTQDAIILQFLIEYQEQYNFGLSYDLNISPLRQANKLRGGPEFVFRFTPPEDYLYSKKAKAPHKSSPDN